MAGGKALEANGRYAAVIREARKALGMNQQQLADSLGMSRNTVAGWETGHSRPDLDLLPALCDSLSLSLASFFGTGESASGMEARMMKSFRLLREEDQEMLTWQVEALIQGRKAQGQLRPQEKLPPRATRAVRPLASARRPLPDYAHLRERVISIFESDLSAAAGTGFPLEAERGQKIWLRRDEMTARADEIVTVNGQSMEPEFEDGDQVLIQHADALREGEIGLFLVDGEGYIKEFHWDGLYSLNPAYGPLRFSEGNEVRCVGRVLGKVKPEQRLSPEENAWMEEQEGTEA